MPNKETEVSPQLLFKEFIEASALILKFIEPRQLDHAVKVAALVHDYLLHIQDQYAKEMFYAAFFHDIGAVALDWEAAHPIVGQPRAKMAHNHPGLSYQIVRDIPGVNKMRSAIEGHHENIDGSGYPHQSSGSHVDFYAQIMKLADNLEILTFYNQGKTKSQINSMFLTRYSNQVEKRLDFRFLHVVDAIGNRNILDDIDATDILLKRSAGVSLNDIDRSSQDIGGKIMLTLARIIDAKQESTFGHTERVTDYSIMIAREMGLEHDELTQLKWTSLMHDTGKAGIPWSILNKKGKLTEKEFAEVRKYPFNGAEIIRSFKSLAKFLGPAIFHNERVDGAGYPKGLKEQQIPLAARIIAVAETFDSLTTDRPHHRSMDKATALIEISENKGTQFDDEVVASALKVLA